MYNFDKSNIVQAIGKADMKRTFAGLYSTIATSLLIIVAFKNLGELMRFLKSILDKHKSA